MNRAETKTKAVKEWLLSGKPLTQWEATMRFHYLRLGALVFDLRKQGYNIKTITVRDENSVGGSYAKYIYEP